MFDKLIDLIVQVWHHLIPVAVVNQYEEGVRLRLGKLHKNYLAPGLHWKIPFADLILTTIVTADTLDVKPVNVTTIDDKTITVGAVIEFEIVDIVKYIVDTNEARSNTHDICRGIMADYLQDCTWAQCKDKKTIRTITRLLTKKCEDMGISITGLTFTDMSLSRVFKLFGDKTTIM